MINKVSEVISVYTQNQKPRSDKQPPTINNTPKNDTVTISDAGRCIETAIVDMKKKNNISVNPDVIRLKAAIENDEYQINAEMIAERMINFYEN